MTATIMTTYGGRIFLDASQDESGPMFQLTVMDSDEATTVLDEAQLCDVVVMLLEAAPPRRDSMMADRIRAILDAQKRCGEP